MIHKCSDRIFIYYLFIILHRLLHVRSPVSRFVFIFNFSMPYREGASQCYFFKRMSEVIVKRVNKLNDIWHITCCTSSVYFNNMITEADWTKPCLINYFFARNSLQKYILNFQVTYHECQHKQQNYMLNIARWSDYTHYRIWFLVFLLEISEALDASGNLKWRMIFLATKAAKGHTTWRKKNKTQQGTLLLILPWVLNFASSIRGLINLKCY